MSIGKAPLCLISFISSLASLFPRGSTHTSEHVSDIKLSNFHLWEQLLTLLSPGIDTTSQANHAAKALITQSSAGGSGAEGPRNYAQVLANSGTASLLILYHLYISSGNGVSLESGFKVGDIIPIGIIA